MRISVMVALLSIPMVVVGAIIGWAIIRPDGVVQSGCDAAAQRDSGTRQYRDDKYHYSFRYPSCLQISDEQGGRVSLLEDGKPVIIFSITTRQEEQEMLAFAYKTISRLLKARDNKLNRSSDDVGLGYPSVCIESMPASLGFFVDVGLGCTNPSAFLRLSGGNVLKIEQPDVASQSLPRTHDMVNQVLLSLRDET